MRIVGRLGAGGMGTVYRALDVERGIYLALKTMRGDADPSALMRFKREFRALADVAHPNLVALGELGEHEGALYYTMGIVDGVELLKWLQAAPSMAIADTAIQMAEDPGAPTEQEATVPPRVPQLDVTAELPAELAAMLTSPITARERPGAAPAPALPPADLDVGRLRRTVGQLVSALRAVHAAGLVHRDVKPSNVMVRADGHVVLLDFGLVRNIHDELGTPGMTGDRSVLGTVEYMAPEQAGGGAVGPAADAYAVGVILYEVLAGRRPFTGATVDVLHEKQTRDPVPPSRLRQGVPPELEELCLALLRRAPQERPDDDEVLERLGLWHPLEVSTSPRAAEPSGVGFIGRGPELAALESAAAAVHGGGAPVVVLVEGESGVGKSALLRRFAENHCRGPDDLVLAGRCSERETVPFNGVDGIMDAVALWLAAADRGRAATIVPRRAIELGRAFPVLMRVPAVARIPKDNLVDDPQERRARVFAAARDLFTRLGDVKRVVMVIDDLQWADDDSLALLGELLRPPEAPPILLLATLRSGEEVERAARALSRRDVAPVEVRRIRVDRLSAQDAQALASAWAPGTDVHRLVEESGGHPLFLAELARHRTATGESGARPTLDELLRARAATVSPAARRLLDLVVLAPAPVDEQLAALALGVTRADIAASVSEVQGAHLARAVPVKSRIRLEPWHARVREALRSAVAPDDARALLLRLAATLEKEGGDEESLYQTLREANEPRRAAVYALRAGERAMESLAFDHATRMFSAALESLEGDERRRVLVRIGDAQGSLGRGPAAAAAYLEAAGSNRSADAVELRRRAAEQLLRAGHFEDGKRVLADVLAAFGLSLPQGTPATVLSLLGAELKNRVRGLDFSARPPDAIDAEARRRIDVTWTAAMGLAGKDNLGSAYFQARHLALALAAGDRYRISRALSLQAGFNALGGDDGRDAALRQLSRARELAIESGHPHALALNRWMSGFCDFMGGRYPDALAHCEEAERMVRETCPDATWERSNCHVYTLSSLAMMGSFEEIGRRLPAYRSEAEARGDLYEICNLPLGALASWWAARHDVAGGRAAIDEALRRWGARSVTSEDVLGAIGHALLDLYEGRNSSAVERADRAWSEAGLFRRVAHKRASLHEIRACGLLSQATGSSDRGALLRAAAEIRDLSKVPLPWAPAVAQLLRASLAQIDGRLDEAAAGLRAAAADLDRLALRLHATGARRCLGVLLGGDEGHRLVADADAWLRAHGVQDPQQLVQAKIPGFGAPSR